MNKSIIRFISENDPYHRWYVTKSHSLDRSRKMAKVFGEDEAHRLANKWSSTEYEGIYIVVPYCNR